MSSDRFPETVACRRAGFSLIEVLAALAITVLLVVTFAPFASQLVTTWGRGARTAELVDMLARANDRIERDLLATVPMTVTRGETTSMLFRGGPGHVLFASATGFGPGRGGLELVSIGIEPDGPDATALVRRRAPLRDAALAPTGFKDPVTLVAGPYRYRFGFVAADGTRVEEWQGRPDMPARVELSIVAGDTLLLPAPLSYFIPADLSAACITDDPPDYCEGEQSTDENGGTPDPDEPRRDDTQ